MPPSTKSNDRSVDSRSDRYKNNLRRWISRNYPETDKGPKSRQRQFLEDFEKRLLDFDYKERASRGQPAEEASKAAAHFSSTQRAYLRSILSEKKTGQRRHLSTDMVARIETLFNIPDVLIDLNPSEQKVPCYVLVQCAPNSIDDILRCLICHPIVDEVAGVIGDVDLILRIWATPESCRDFLWFGLKELKQNEDIHRTTTYMPIGSTYHTKLTPRTPRRGEPTEIRNDCIYGWHKTRGVTPSSEIIKYLKLNTDMSLVDRIYQAGGEEGQYGEKVIGMVLRSTPSVKQSEAHYHMYFLGIDHNELYKTHRNKSIKCYPLRGGDIALWHLSFSITDLSHVDKDLCVVIDAHNKKINSLSDELQIKQVKSPGI